MKITGGNNNKRQKCYQQQSEVCWLAFWLSPSYVDLGLPIGIGRIRLGKCWSLLESGADRIERGTGQEGEPKFAGARDAEYVPGLL